MSHIRFHELQQKLVKRYTLCICWHLVHITERFHLLVIPHMLTENVIFPRTTISHFPLAYYRNQLMQQLIR